MTPPELCLNCHGNSYTTEYSGFGESTGPCLPATENTPAQLNCLEPLGPDWFRRDPLRREHWRETAEELLVSQPWLNRLPPIEFPPVHSVDALPACPAEARWPEWLRTPRPDGSTRTWWVRGNYEALRDSGSRFRIDVERAAWHASFDLRSGHALPLVRGWVDLLAGDDARIDSSLEIRHNHLDLVMAHLLDLQNVVVDLPGTEVPLYRVSTGDFGGVHAITRVPTWLAFFFEPFMVPHVPVGYDQPSFEQMLDSYAQPQLFERCLDPGYAADHAGTCPQPLLYPDRSQPTELFDINPLALLPESLSCRIAGLFDDSNRLPQMFGLEALIAAVGEMPARSCPAGSGNGMNLDDLLNFVRSGSVEVNLEQLNDFFIPGVIDLGDSSGVLRAFLSEDRSLDLGFEDFNIALEAMGYGISACTGPEASLHPSVQLHWANLTPGPEPEGDPFINPQFLLPGIHVRRGLESADTVVEANFQIEGEITLPLVGPVYFSTGIRARFHTGRGDDGSSGLQSGGNFLTFDHLRLQRRGESGAVLDLDVALNDALNPAGTIWRLALVGSAQGHELNLSAELPLETDWSGNVRFGGFEDIWGFTGKILLGLGGRERIDTDFAFRSEASETPNLLPSSRHYSLSFDADRSRAGRPNQALVRGGRLDWERLRETACREEDRVILEADALRWGEMLLNGVSLQVVADEIAIGPGESHVHVSDLSLALNQNGSNAGPIRGTVSLAQDRATPIDIHWYGPERHLTMSGLDADIRASGLYVLPDALRRGLDPAVASVGIDGNLGGGLSVYLPANPRCTHGSGDLRLAGDRDGDIYFLNARGERVGAPLFRSTSWNFNQIDWINTRRGYALGRFSLETILNLSAAPNFSTTVYLPSGDREFSGIRTGGLGPYEIAAAMVYNNQPLLPAQFHNRIEDYLFNLFDSPGVVFDSSSRRVPRECREGAGR